MLINTLCRQFSTTRKCLKKIHTNNLKVKNAGTSSKLWLSRQLSDPYVEKAKMYNYRCRSAFKLLEIDEKFTFFHPGQTVIDCGAAPGSWTQIAAKKVNADQSIIGENRIGTVISIDKQHIYPIDGATIFGNMDFTSPQAQQKLLDHLNGEKAHVVLSDMAPSATGIRDLDNENMMHLCYSALRFAVQISQPVSGVFLVKLWQCGDREQLEKDILKFYDMVRLVKPAASRADSSEVFLLAKGFKGLKKDGILINK